MSKLRNSTTFDHYNATGAITPNANGNSNGNVPVRSGPELRIDTTTGTTNNFRRPTEDPDELTPDSMSSRIVDSAAAGLDETMFSGDLIFDRMGSRIVTNN